MQDRSIDNIYFINDNNIYVINNLTFGDQMIDKQESITRIPLQHFNGLELSSHKHMLELILDSIWCHLIKSAYLCERNTIWKQNSGLKNPIKL